MRGLAGAGGPAGALELRAVRGGYAGVEVLRGISLAVRPGELVALIGPNGSGKTTLLRTMGRLLRPLAGQVLLDGADLWKLGARRVARSVGWVPQNARLAWPFTVQQVVALGRFPHRGWIAAWTAEDHRAVDEALAATGMEAHRDRPLGTLSGGEVQRAMLARVLAQRPRLLLLDEPVAHLDMKYKIAVLDLARGLARRGLAVVISLHDLNLAGLYADRVILLADGRVFAEGPPERILARENLEAVYETRVIVGRYPGRDGRPLVNPVPGWLEPGPESGG